MRIELTEAQKKYIEECDQKIAALRSEIQTIDKKIFELQIKKQVISTQLPIFELDEDDKINYQQEWVRVNPRFGGPLIDRNAVVKIKPYDKDERS